MIAATRDDFDVVILGGGPAGCAAALTLAASGVARVLVVESSRYERPRIGESIPPDTRRLLAALDLLDAFQAEGHEPCLGSCSSWGGDELGYNDFIFNPCGHGWHLDRLRFDRFLARVVRERGVELRTETRFLDVVAHGEAGARLRVRGPAGEAEIATRFVVDATGPRSLYARRLGSARRESDRLVNVSALFDRPEEGSRLGRLTMLEAVEYGWWYTARLPAGRVATAVATSHRLYKEGRLDHEPVWRAALRGTRHVGAALAGCRFVPGSVAVRTAPCFVLDRVHGAHWLAVGDAAASYDPISSQGIFKALADGLDGGRAIAAHLRGDPRALAEHQAGVEEQFAEHERQRAYFYDREGRWPNAPFWAERRATTAPIIAPGSSEEPTRRASPAADRRRRPARSPAPSSPSP